MLFRSKIKLILLIAAGTLFYPILCFSLPIADTNDVVISTGYKKLGSEPSKKNTFLEKKLLKSYFKVKRLNSDSLLARGVTKNETRKKRLISKFSSPCSKPRIKRLLRSCSECSCSPNWTLFSNATPNDTLYSTLWGLQNSNDIDIDADLAWNTTTGSSSVVIGVVDSGVKYNHPDLSSNMWVNPGETASNGIDDDGNGVVDDIYGINAITNSGNPMDDNGHGTHCAGTIGAVGNNSQGVAGVAWNVKIVAGKFLDSDGSGFLSDAIQALDYMVDLKQNRGINIVAINNSWGGGAYSQSLYDCIERVKAAGIVFVAAAGNDATNNDTTASYPATYSNTNIISVAAVGTNGSLASFSNYGANNVMIAAPGVSINSTYLANSYAYLSGTSMAAPHVTGVIALLKSEFPSLSINSIKAALKDGSDVRSSLNGVVNGARFLNANGALLLAANPAATPTNTPTNTPTSLNSQTPEPTNTPDPFQTLTPIPTIEVPTSTPTIEPVLLSEIALSPKVLKRGKKFKLSLLSGVAPVTVEVRLGKRLCGLATITGSSLQGKLSRVVPSNVSALKFVVADESGIIISTATSKIASDRNRYAKSMTQKACQDILNSLN
jgi:subtilisin family serine protease